LRKDGIRVKLQEQPFQVLVALLERPQEVVTREELQNRLWSGDTATDFDRGLNKAISRLRDALGDDAANPRFIGTLPQRGYRWLAPTESLAYNVSSIVATQQGRRAIPRRGFLWLGGSLIAAPIVGVLAYRSFGRFPKIQSIAVLPLVNVSSDPGQEYFSDGMTEELTAEISRITSLRVISRTSVMRYKTGARKAVPEIARELNVDAIVEGTVALSGSRVRITAELIAARDERHLWSERYERDLADILSLQSEVARRIAREIRIQLTPEEQIRLTRTRPVDPAAYNAYLKGSYFLSKAIAGLSKSIDFFNEAIRLDPGHADSHAGLAQALSDAGIYGLRPPKVALPAARVIALQALKLDASNANAHRVLAEIQKGYDWNLGGAVLEYQRALQLNPNQMLSHLRYADCLSRMERHSEALAEVELGRRLDPVSPMSNGFHAMVLFRARRFDDAIGAARQALELDPVFVNALWWQGMSYAGKQYYTEAIDCLTKAVGMSDNLLFRALRGHVYGLAGERSKAIQAIEEHTKEETAKRRYVSPVDFAILHAGLGNANPTFRWLEEAYQERSPRLHELTFMYFDRIRSDTRYSEFVRRVGLPA
jgi:TolB-like protein/DNA-binding winged helix-turn-helix (wHTH) protein/cytochrome c-type biogenesis protein CcmH/NrfG